MRVMMMSRDLGIHLEIMMWITQLMKVLVKLLSLHQPSAPCLYQLQCLYIYHLTLPTYCN